MNKAVELPAYQVRQSGRARNVNLTFNPVDGLTIVVPNGFDTRLIPVVLLEQRDWILRQVDKYQFRPRSDAAFRIPQTIRLEANGAEWTLRPKPGQNHAVRISQHRSRVLRLTGDLDDTAAVQRALHRWLKRAARGYLPTRLQAIAERHTLEFDRVTIRLQRSRWGSCSAAGAISLNARLMFLAPDLVDHVLLHELCHTVHLNHGRDFWELVASHEPDYRTRRRRLAASWSAIPDWALSRRAA